MPTITLSHSMMRRIQEINGSIHHKNDLSDLLPKMGCPVELNDDENIEIEVFPDRPDLLSHETMAKAVRSFQGDDSDMSSIEVSDSGIRISVEGDLEGVRPIIMGAVVRGVNTGNSTSERDSFIQSLMDHQEKLHMTLGRKRSLASIGVHDLSKIKYPFRYESVSGDFSFEPLASEDVMSISEILDSHPKGIEYSKLMDGLDTYPIILDSNDEVISFPPIINGNHTTVSEDTNDFFIDVTGFDEIACETCLLLVSLSLSELGGVVESVEVWNKDGSVMVTPNFGARTYRVPNRLIEKILGMELSDSEISEAIRRMGGISVSYTHLTLPTN